MTDLDGPRASRLHKRLERHLLFLAGVPEPVALEVMGHADPRILRHDQEVVGDLKQEAARRMNELLG